MSKDDWDNWKFDPSKPSPQGNPNCEVCKNCKCYKTCFSGIDGFPKTSSNFGRSQASCATHEKECGIKHYKKQTTLEEYC